MFLLMIFLILHRCVNANYYEVKNFRSQDSILSNIFQNSGIDVKTLKQLAKDFPNHAIEIQIQGTQHEDLTVKNKLLRKHRLGEDQHSYQKGLDRIGRSGDDQYHDSALLANASAPDQVLPQQQQPATTTTTTMTTMTTKLETVPTTGDLFPRHQPKDGLKRPLYMEDLIQALEDFEQKKATKAEPDDYGTSSTSYYADRPVVKKDLWDLEKFIYCIAGHESRSDEKPTLPHTDNRNIAVKNFHDVVRLIKKGVKVQLDVTTPRHRDPNFKWVPIKVPSKTYNI